MKILRIYNRNKFFFLSLAFFVSFLFNMKFFFYENVCLEKTRFFLDQTTNVRLKYETPEKSIQSQDFKNAKVVIDKGDYFIPANVIKGTEYFGDFKKKAIFDEANFKLNNPCEYARTGARVLCAIFTHSKAHEDLKFIQNTWARR